MELLNYLLKVSACSALFFAFYILVLRRLTFFKLNRFFLLFSLLLSFSIPAFEFTVERIAKPVMFDREIGVAQVHRSNGLQAFSSLNDQLQQNWDWLSLLTMIYVGIVATLLIFAIWKLIQLFRHASSGGSEVNGLKIVPKEKGFTNCSFFNYVFIDENSLTRDELEVLLIHEEVHAKQLHSIDKILLITLKAILWFNPIIYLYDRALEEAHEYDADETTSKNVGTDAYAYLLLKLAVIKSDMPLVHNFVKSPIKLRIKMLFNSKSERVTKWAYLFVFPLSVTLVWSFAVNVVYAAPIFSQGVREEPHQEQIIPFPQEFPEKALASKVASADTIKFEAKQSKRNVVNFMILEASLETQVNNEFYSRYAEIDDKRVAYDVVKITLASGSNGAAYVPSGTGKVIIIINGKAYTENAVKGLFSETIKGITSISVVDHQQSIAKAYPKLAGKCDAVIELPKMSQERLNKLH